MSKVRVAVIGCGSIAKHRHIPEYAANPEVQLVAFVDPVLSRAESFANAHGATAYATHEDLFKNEELDAVSVCTPNVFHAPISIAALNHGLHVLCEKPMAVSESEANAMVSAAKSNGVYLMIGHNQRLMAPHIKGREILQSGILGKVLTFRTAFGHGGPEGWSVEGPGGWFFQKKKAFIGAMGDLGIHKADLIRWLLNDEIAEVGAFVSTLHKKDTDVDDNAVCIVRTAGGALGTLTASWSYMPNEDNSTILYCEKGTLRLNADPIHQVIVERHQGPTDRYEIGAIATNENQTASGVIDAFVRSIVTQTPPAISGEEGKKSLNVILAMLESSSTRQFVEVRG